MAVSVLYIYIEIKHLNEIQVLQSENSAYDLGGLIILFGSLQ